MNEVNIFEVAVKEKFRFPFKGTVTVEDLYDLSLENLDGVFKTLNSQHKKTEEESLLGKKTKEENELSTKIEIVKYIVTEKLAEAAKRAKAKERKEQKQKIMEVMANQQDAALRSKTPEELQKMLDELDD
jgi:hypothetical protein